MTRFYLVLAVCALVSATTASAQNSGGGGSAYGGGVAGNSGGGSGGGGGGGSATGTGNSVGGTAVNLSGLSNATAGLTSIGTTAGGGASSQIISNTNFLQGNFGNPLYVGRPNTTQIGIGTGNSNFGQPSFGTTSTAIGGNGGTAGITTGGRGGMAASSASSASTIARFTGGSLGTSSANISYQAVLKFTVPTVPTSQRVADLNAMIARSSALQQPGNYQVLMENGVITVRGKAADSDERRLVEGLLRLEPGVREVRNEIAVP